MVWSKDFKYFKYRACIFVKFTPLGVSIILQGILDYVKMSRKISSALNSRYSLLIKCTGEAAVASQKEVSWFEAWLWLSSGTRVQRPALNRLISVSM